MKTRNLKTKAISILFAFVMLAGMLSMTAFAADGDSFEADGMTYTVLSESAATVSLTQGKKETADETIEITIPATVEYNGKIYTVTVVGSGAFASYEKIVKVTIPETVTTIEYEAFDSCINLGGVCFDGTPSIKTIGNGAFIHCLSLTSFSIPDGVTDLAASVFLNTGLTSIHIPASVTAIGSVDPAFDTSSLTEYTVADDNPNYSALDGVLFNKDKTTLVHYPMGKTGDTYGIPESVTAIGYDAFTGSKLVSLEIPKNVQTIQTDAVNRCTLLKNISLPSTASIEGGSLFLADCTALENIEVSGEGGNLKSVDGVLFADNGKELMVYPVAKAENSYTIPEGTETIAGHSLKKAKNLKSVTIPYSVTKIGNYAFRETGITEVYYGNLEEDWAKITLGTNVFPQNGVTMHYADIHTHYYGYEGESDGESCWRECSCGEKIEAAIPTVTEEPVAPEIPTIPVEDLFSDVFADWYTDYIQYVYDNALMTGIKGTDRFEPNANITKAQVAQVLYNMEKQPEITDMSVFSQLKDVYTSEWYAAAVAWAYGSGIVTGDLNTKEFKPNDNVTREQLALMLYRYSDYKGYDIDKTSSLLGLENSDQVSSWADAGVRWAVGNGLISGVEMNGVKDLAPQGNATRAQMAAILQRFCTYVVKQ